MTEVPSRYKAAFVLPKNTTATLTDNGWDFTSPSHLDESVLAALAVAFNLRVKDEHSEVTKYHGQGLEASAIRDGQNHCLSEIYLQVFDEVLFDRLEALFQEPTLSDKADFFVPMRPKKAH